MHPIPFKPKAILAFPVLLVVFLTSCTITKRHYRPGYHIEWRHAAHNGMQPQAPVKEPGFNRAEPADTLLRFTQKQEPKENMCAPVVSYRQLPVNKGPRKVLPRQKMPVPVQPFAKKRVIFCREKSTENEPMKLARRAHTFGIISLVLFFTFIASMFALGAMEAAQKALVLNEGGKDPWVTQKAYGAMKMARINIIVCFILLWAATIAFCIVILPQLIATLSPLLIWILPAFLVGILILVFVSWGFIKYVCKPGI